MAEANNGLVHLVNDMVRTETGYEYKETMCGDALDSVKEENWTDAILEVLAGSPLGICPRCWRVATRVGNVQSVERAMAREMVREATMLSGAEAGNDLAEILGFKGGL